MSHLTSWLQRSPAVGVGRSALGHSFFFKKGADVLGAVHVDRRGARDCADERGLHHRQDRHGPAGAIYK